MQRDVRFAPVLAQLQAAGFVANVSAPGELEPKLGLDTDDRLQATFRAGLSRPHTDRCALPQSTSPTPSPPSPPTTRATSARRTT